MTFSDSQVVERIKEMADQWQEHRQNGYDALASAMVNDLSDLVYAMRGL